MATDTPSPLFQKPFLQLKEIIKSMIIILSDHKNLMYYQEAKKLNRGQAQWSLYLSEFDVKLVHTPGNEMVQSDALSWRPDLCPEEDNDNEDIVMLPDELFVSLIDTDLQERIANGRRSGWECSRST